MKNPLFLIPLFLILSFFLLAGRGESAVENFSTGWTETDPNSRLSQTATRSTWTGLTGNEVANLAKNAGVNFTGDWDIAFDFYVDSASTNAYGLSNFYLSDATNTYLFVIQLGDQDGTKCLIKIYDIELSGFTGEEAVNTTTLNVNTTYYARYKRKEAVGGNYGTIYLDVYANDANRQSETSPLIQLSYNIVNLGGFRDMTVVHIPDTQDFDETQTVTGYLENLDLAYVPPLPTLDQKTFRFRNNDGNETAATWIAAENTNITAPSGTPIRFRGLINSTGDPAAKNFQIDYKKLADSVWNKLEPSSTTAIAFVNNGTKNVGTTTLAVDYPASIAANDLLLLDVYTKNQNYPTTPENFTLIGATLGNKGGNGADAGNATISSFYRIATGAETGTQAVAISSGNSAVGQMYKYTRGTGRTWNLTYTIGNDTNGGTAWNITGAADPNIAAGDMIHVASGVNSDLPKWSGEFLAVPSATVANATERSESNTTQGNDGSLVVADFTIDAGASAGAPTYNMVGSNNATSSSAGGTIFVRIRQDNQFLQLNSSVNVADNASTTGQLTGPGGSFVAGRFVSNVNPANATDITSGNYTEMEACVNATALAATNDVYNLRWSASGTALDTYSQNASWTIGTAAAGGTKNVLRECIARGICRGVARGMR